MSLEQSLANVVQAANQLTDAVNGKMAQIDQHQAQSTAQINQQLEAVKLMLPRLVFTKNQILTIDNATNLPKNFSLNANVTATFVMGIAANPAARNADQIAMLQEIEAATGANLQKTSYYREGFNIIKLSWTSDDAGFLAYPQASDSPSQAAVPLNTYFTIGAFVKVLSGSVTGSWATGAELGKWKFCSAKFNPSGFGRYTHLHPYRGAAPGELLVALPAAITGHIEHPIHWFPNILLGGV